MIPKGVIFHCSASDIEAHNDISVIDRWHKERGFKKVGYQWFINWDGEKQRGRKDSEFGAHCKGYNDYIGICLHGDKMFFQDQFVTAIELCKYYVKKYGWTRENFHGHCDFNSHKTCPNFDYVVEILDKVF